MGDKKDMGETDSDVYFSKLKPYSAYDLPSEIMIDKNQGKWVELFFSPSSLSLSPCRMSKEGSMLLLECPWGTRIFFLNIQHNTTDFYFIFAF